MQWYKDVSAVGSAEVKLRMCGEMNDFTNNFNKKVKYSEI